MGRGFTLLCLLFLVGAANRATAQARPEQPHFALNAPEHAGNIGRARFLPNGKTVATVSADKTVRLWDVATRQPTHTFRVPIGAGLEGALGTLAVSGDGTRVAVGGVAGPNGGLVYLISLPEGKIVQTFDRHEGYVYGVDFSPRGDLLVSVGSDNVGRVWDVATGKQVRTLTGHTDTIFGLTFSPDGKSVATASRDKTVRVWNVGTGEWVKSLDHPNHVRTVAWSDDGARLATGGWDGTLRLWQADGTLRKTLETKQPVFSVAFAPGSKTVAMVSAARNLPTEPIRPTRATFVDVATGTTGATTDEFYGDLNDIAFSPDGKLAVVCGGLTGEARLVAVATGKVIGSLRPAAEQVTVVGWSRDGTGVSFGTSSTEAEADIGKRPLTVAFDFTQLELQRAKAGDSFPNRVRNRWATNATTGIGELNAVGYSFIQNSRLIATVKLPDDKDRIRSRPALSPDDSLAVVGSELSGWVHQTGSGRLLHKLTGHSGTIHDAVFSADGKFLVSGGGDRTVRVWKVGRELPLVSLFVTGNDWIAWTPEGYYAASPGGEKLVGWQINNGLEKSPTFHPAERFHESLYRPDALKLLLKHGNLDDALKAADAARGNGNPGRIDITKVEPPKVEFEGDLTVGADGKITVAVKATSPVGDGITALTLLVNGGRTLGDNAEKPKSGARATERAEWGNVQLEPGTNVVKVFAKTDRSEGAGEVTLEFQKAKKPPANRPTLHLLTVSIDQYSPAVPAADRLPRLFQSVNGAKGVEQAIETNVGGPNSPYAKARVVPVLGEQATRERVLADLRAFAGDVTSDRDVAVVYLSGHGVLVDPTGSLAAVGGESSGVRGEKWVFCPHDFRKSKPVGTGITDDELCAELQKIKASRVLLVIDACHSGGINGAVARKAGRESNGFDVLCACQPDQKAFERGGDDAPLFTKFIVSGLRNELKEYSGPVYARFPDLVGEGVAFNLLQTGVGYVMNQQGGGQKMVAIPSARGEYLLTTPKK